MQDFQIIRESESGFTVLIINTEKLHQIDELRSPLIIICKNGKSFRARGNIAILSGAPDDCDYFYPTTQSGLIFYFQNRELIFNGPVHRFDK